MTLTIPGHAQTQTFLEAAVLAPVPVDAVHNTVLVTRTLVVDHGALGAPEEALAAFACYHSIVHATALVPTHFTRYNLNLR